MKRALALCLLACLTSACRTPSPGVLLPPDDPRPGRLLESLHERARLRTSLRASARLALESPDLRLNRPQRLAVSRPARLRVEVLGLFNQVAAVLVTDGEIYQLYDARRGDLEEGVVSAHLLWRVARVDLDPHEAVELLLGVPVPLSGLSLGEVRLFDDGGIGVEQRDGQGVARQRFRFDAAGHLRRLASLDGSGQLVWQALFDDYRGLPGPAGDEAFAHGVRLSFPRVEAEARLTFKQVDLVSGTPDELFVLELAESAAARRPADRSAAP